MFSKFAATITVVSAVAFITVSAAYGAAPTMRTRGDAASIVRAAMAQWAARGTVHCDSAESYQDRVYYPCVVTPSGSLGNKVSCLIPKYAYGANLKLHAILCTRVAA